MSENASLKAAVASACLSPALFSPFDHVFLDCGSTFAYVAKRIFDAAPAIAPLTIYTTNMEVFAMYLASRVRDLIDFRLVGGRFIPHHNALDGSCFALSKASHPDQAAFDRAFIGVCPLAPDLTVMATVTDVVSVKQHIISKAREIIVLCDQTKFVEPPLGSRSIGRLILDQSKLSFLLSNNNSICVPARIIIGVTPNELPAGVQEFMKSADDFGLLAAGLVRFAEAQEEYK
jgi:hypothetical protein